MNEAIDIDQPVSAHDIHSLFTAAVSGVPIRGEHCVNRFLLLLLKATQLTAPGR